MNCALKDTPRNWITANRTLVEETLHARARDFIIQHSGIIPKYDLRFDNRWHYINQQRKSGYKGRVGQNLSGVPFLKLTFNTFKQGGYSATFDDKAVIKELYQTSKLTQAGQTSSTPKNTPPQSEPPPLSAYNLPDINSAEAIARAEVEKKKTEERKKRAIKEDLALWERLPAQGVSDYLKRKNLLHVEGIRYGKDFISVLIIDTDGVGQGLQKIFNDGRKKFTYGLNKKGNFAVLGASFSSLKKNSDEIYLCEGIATGMSIHLATGQPVFCALDAGNLPLVTEQLRKRFIKAIYTIWADNDQWKDGNLTRDNRLLGNTGLISAHNVAMKNTRTFVRKPDFDVDQFLGTCNEKDLPTDFNDLHQHFGLDALSETALEYPNPEYAFFHIKEKQKKRLARLSQSTFATVINSRYLPNNLTFEPGLHIIRSPIGTGKTELMARVIENQSSVLYISHLVSLVEDAAKRLNLVSYNQCGAASLRETERLAICINSLFKLSQKGQTPHFDVLIIDEVEQLIRRLTSDITNKPLVLDTLRYLVKNANVVIGLDAHASRNTTDILHEMCPDKNFHLLVNEYTVGEGRTLIYYPDKETLQQKALDALDDDKNCFLTFNSKTEASKVAHLIEKQYPGKEGLFICADNTGEENVQAFIADVNKESAKYDYIITTPSMNTGVSIDNNHFDFVGGCFCNTVNTPEDCMQALGRVRNAKTLHVYTDKHKKPLPLDEKTIAAKWMETHEHDLALMSINEDGERVVTDEGYNRLYLSVMQSRNRALTNFFYSFNLLAYLDGYEIIFYEESLEKDAKELLKVHKTLLAEADYQKRLLNAEPISKAKFSELKRRNRRTQEETDQVEKHVLQHFYKLSPHADEMEWLAVISQDNKGKKRIEVLNLERALANKEMLKELYIKQTLEAPKFVPDIKHYATEADLYRRLLIELKLYNEKLGILQNKNFTYDKEILCDSGFMEWVIKKRSVLQGVINVPTIEDLKCDPLRFIAKLLANLGLKQIRVGRNDKGRYRIDDEELQLMIALIKQRGNALCDSTPLSTIARPETKTIIETTARAKPCDLERGDEWEYFHGEGEVEMMDVPITPYERETMESENNVLMNTSDIMDENDYATYTDCYESLQHQSSRIKTALTRKDDGEQELERYNAPSRLVDVGDSFLAWNESYFEDDFDEVFFVLLWFLWQLFGFEYDVWAYEFYDDDEEYEYKDEEERRADPIFVNAEVVQPVLEYQKKEPLLLTYQPSFDEGTLVVLYILNARSVPEAFCCFLMSLLSLDAVSPELRLLAANLLLSRIEKEEHLLLTLLLYAILAMNCAYLYGRAFVRVGEWCFDSPWYCGLSLSKDRSWAHCPKVILPARLSLCTTHTTACLCYVLLLKALQMG